MFALPEQTEQQDNPQPEEELDIESQLDALLAQLDEIEPDLLGKASSGASVVADEPPTPAQPTEVAPEVAAPDQDLQPSQEPAPPTTAGQIDALRSQDLADQPDQVLDASVADTAEAEVDEASEMAVPDAVEAESVGVAVPPVGESSDPSPDDGGADSDMAQKLQALLDGELDQGDAPDEPVAQEVVVDQGGPELEQVAAATPVPEEPEAEAQEAEELSMDQIDDLLAEEAEEFAEDPIDVSAEPVAVVDLTPPVEDRSAPPATSQVSASEKEEQAAPLQAAPVAQPDIDADATTAGGFNASAQAVAQELDEQPELNAGVTTIRQMAEAADRSKKRKRLKLRLDKQGLMVKVMICERVLKQTCRVVNRPLNRLSPVSRDLIGYTGLGHALVGVLLIISKLVFG